MSIERSRGTAARSIAVAAVGGIVLLVGVAAEPDRVAASYLTAYAATLAVVLGTLLLITMTQLSGAIWFAPLRRLADAIVGGLPGLAALTVPLLIAPHAFWPRPASYHTYFHPAFFTTRAVAYWVVWLWTGAALRRNEQLSRVSAIGLVLGAVALHFAAIDWFMAVSAAWTSTVYSGYYFAGAMVNALALLACVARIVPFTVAPTLTTDHFQALGRLLLAFLLFWGYLWYAQFFIIWIADVPREITWYAVRLAGGWGATGVVMLVAGFVVPFIVLVFHAARGSAVVMSALGVWLLAAHYLDMYWLLMPSVRPEWSVVDLVWDAASLAFVGGVVVSVAAWRATSAGPLYAGHPPLRWPVGYEAH